MIDTNVDMYILGFTEAKDILASVKISKDEMKMNMIKQIQGIQQTENNR